MQVFYFTLLTACVRYIKKESVFYTILLELFFFARRSNDFFKYKFYRQTTGVLFFFFLGYGISRCGNCSLRRRIGCHERYVLRSVADESDEGPDRTIALATKRYSRRTIVIGSRRSLVLSFLYSRGPPERRTPPFSRISPRSLRLLPYVLHLTASSRGPEAPATRPKSSSPRVMSSRTRSRGRARSSSSSARPRRPCRHPLL